MMRRFPSAAAKSLSARALQRVHVPRYTVRSVWSTGTDPTPASHPLHNLTPSEISATSAAVKEYMSSSSSSSSTEDLRFVAVSLKEGGSSESRSAEVLVLNSSTGIASELTVDLSGQATGSSPTVVSSVDLPRGTQPMLTPEDCDLAEEISKGSTEVQEALKERYGIEDMAEVAADPWSVHLADDADRSMTEPASPDMPPRRLVQTFLYKRLGGSMDDNAYAHPIDIVPVVDLNSKVLVRIDGLDRLPAPQIPEIPVQYNRNLLHTNTYLQNEWRHNTLKALDITQPDGPSFTVTDGNLVTWANWQLRVGFNYREGLVLQDVTFDGRPVMKKGSLVEMAVPYGDPNPPYQRKCAFDVGDYGLGYCANSLELGCDCLGHIHYFDAYMCDSKGEPSLLKKAICMHEEDDGILWKHVEYRNGHNEARRSRELVLSSIATVVNYEYLFYWRLKLDGSIDFEIRLSGELSTNLPSTGEDPKKPDWGTIVSPGVNAQVHQHMFCARLDMSVDGTKNTVSEVDVVAMPSGPDNPYGNAFGAQETVLKSEQDAVRTYDATKARTWKISNAEGKVNEISGKPVAYKLIPFTRGPAQPPLLTDETCEVSKKGAFANAHLWVTPYAADERYPAGEYTPQAQEQDGLPKWIEGNRNVEGEDVVLWHAFGVTHVPRVEDFPVMPCETTGFTLKPDGFSLGNPGIDLPPATNTKSKLDSGCCES